MIFLQFEYLFPILKFLPAPNSCNYETNVIMKLKYEIIHKALYLKIMVSSNTLMIVAMRSM